jgi:hypothetical protein
MSAFASGTTPRHDCTRPSRYARVRRFLTISRRREIVWRALRLAALVGTVLALINHGPTLLARTMDAGHWLQVVLTYVVPYCVSTYAATQQEMRHRAGTIGGEEKSDINPPQRDYVNTVNKS